MSMYSNPEELAANPPETWRVIKRGMRWGLYIDAAAEHPVRSFDTKRDALAERDDPQSRIRREVEWDRRWYEGETPAGWKSWAECKAEQERLAERQAQREASSPSYVPEHWP